MKPIKVHSIKTRAWKDINHEYQAWKKTPGFEKWKRSRFLKQGGTCFYCNDPLNGTRINVEHIVPKSKGGDNRTSNLVLACSSCNKVKNTTLVPKKRLEELRTVNKKKRGTYQSTQDIYKSEAEIAIELRDMFRED